jgi:mannose-6-phosphate isomerase
MTKIVKLNPFISERVWAGTRLAKLKKLDPQLRIGETWEVSSLAEGASKLNNQNLYEFCELSYLVKFIDTSDNLSIQVHPNDAYAKMNENSSGKSECWLILQTDEGSGVYLGFKKGLTKKEFFNAVEAKLPIDKFLNFLPVKPGDFFYVPAGTVHAIGKGVTLCEVQESSLLTYRVWDWNRPGIDGNPRELHVDKTKDVLDFSDSFNDNLSSFFKSNLLDSVGIQTLIEHEKFKVELYSNTTQKKLEINLPNKCSLILLEGEISGDINLEKYESSLVLEEGTFHFTLAHRSSFLLVSEV